MLSGLSVFKFIEFIFRLIYVQTHLCLVYLCPGEYMTRSICVHVNQYSINLFSGVSVFRSICFCFRTVCFQVKLYSSQTVFRSLCAFKYVFRSVSAFRSTCVPVHQNLGLSVIKSVIRSICVQVYLCSWLIVFRSVFGQVCVFRSIYVQVYLNPGNLRSGKYVLRSFCIRVSRCFRANLFSGCLCTSLCN